MKMRWFFLVWCMLSEDITFANGIKSGPYYATFAKVSSCDNPDPPYATEPVLRWQAEVYETAAKMKLMRGNVTVLQKFKRFSGKFKEFYQQNGKWSLSRVHSQRCNGLLLPILFKSVNMSYDSVDCVVDKGFFAFENLDLNEKAHIFSREREYGRMMWLMHYYMRNITIACCEIESLVTPI